METKYLFEQQHSGFDQQAYQTRLVRNERRDIIQQQDEFYKDFSSQKQTKESSGFSIQTADEFISYLTHEIRSTLNAIVNVNRLLLNTHLNSAQKDYVHNVMACSEILLSIVNNVLDFSKMKAGKIELEKTPFHLSNIIEKVSKIYRVQTIQKGLKFSTDTDEVHHEIIGDPFRLCQILINLISNALKFTNQGEITVRVRVEKETETRITLSFEVSDTGIGISEKSIDRLFHSFTQGDSSVARQFGGTGLGLVISKHLVELMGGGIRVESKEGVGTTFRFIAPFEKGKPIVKKPVLKQEVMAADNSAIRIPESLRILLVEDDPMNQHVCLSMLKKNGLSADTANNGVEAVEMLNAKPYDLVLMDIEMPVLNGDLAAGMIRNSESVNRNIPIIALTGHEIKTDQEKFIQQGMTECLTKPVDMQQLIEKIRKYGMGGGETGQSESKKTAVRDHSRCVFDRKELFDRLGKDERLFRDLIIMGRKEILTQVKQVQEMLQSGVVERIGFEAHKLAGMAANFGAQQLCDTAYELLKCIEKREVENYQSFIEKLSLNLKDLYSILECIG